MKVMRGQPRGRHAARNSAVLAGGAFFVLTAQAMTFRSAAVALVCVLAVAPAVALDLRRERYSSYDLALTGRLAGIPEGETRYARWSDLRALPTSQVELEGEFVPGPQVLTVVFLSDLWKALPVAQGADTLLATCADGYASVFTSGFIAKCRPFLVLEINGKGPKEWPPPGLNYNPFRRRRASPMSSTRSRGASPRSRSLRTPSATRPSTPENGPPFLRPRRRAAKRGSIPAPAATRGHLAYSGAPRRIVPSR